MFTLPELLFSSYLGKMTEINENTLIYFFIGVVLWVVMTL